MTRSPEPFGQTASPTAGPAGGVGVPLAPFPEHYGAAFRPATPEDLPACAAIWRESINDYLAPRNIGLIPDELGPITRLYRHLQATDPARFVVATRGATDGPIDERIVAFASAVERDRLWFLSMLFVRPGEQGRGLGRALLDRVMPEPAHGRVLATATDSMQPISNALYASLGIVPRMPLLSVVGRPEQAEALEPLPEGVRPAPMEPSDTQAIDAIDVEILGATHRVDHDYITAEGRTGFVYRSADGLILGYGYTSAVGRVGPVAVHDEALLWPVVSHLLTVIEPRGASAVWTPGASSRVAAGLLQAGMRLEDYPILVCWSEPFADFSRYVPISPGLL
jgi:GNAT superfamily N-acetyltransferase